MWAAKNFEEKMTPFIDLEYKKIFKDRLVSVTRNSRETATNEKLMFMDLELAIDTHLKFIDGSVVTFQEKTRRNYYKKYDDFTFEYYNDPRTKEIGEWFKLASQLYFYGYANAAETGYEKYYIINVVKLRTGIMQKYNLKQLEYFFLRQNIPPPRANFFAIPFSILKTMNGVIVYEHMSTPSNTPAPCQP